MITENGVELSTTQFYKRIKSALKEDSVMNGSGHLYLHPDQKPLDEIVLASVQEHTLEALQGMGIDGFDEEKARGLIAAILRQIALPRRGAREPGTPRLNKKPKAKGKQKSKKVKPQKPQKPQVRRKDEVRTVQVTVKKSRGFHYPRDLTTPSGDS